MLQQTRKKTTYVLPDLMSSGDLYHIICARILSEHAKTSGDVSRDVNLTLLPLLKTFNASKVRMEKLKSLWDVMCAGEGGSAAIVDESRKTKNLTGLGTKINEDGDTMEDQVNSTRLLVDYYLKYGTDAGKVIRDWTEQRIRNFVPKPPLTSVFGNEVISMDQRITQLKIAAEGKPIMFVGIRTSSSNNMYDLSSEEIATMAKNATQKGYYPVFLKMETGTETELTIGDQTLPVVSAFGTGATIEEVPAAQKLLFCHLCNVLGETNSLQPGAIKCISGRSGLLDMISFCGTPVCSLEVPRQEDALRLENDSDYRRHLLQQEIPGFRVAFKGEENSKVKDWLSNSGTYPRLHNEQIQQIREEGLQTADIRINRPKIMQQAWMRHIATLEHHMQSILQTLEVPSERDKVIATLQKMVESEDGKSELIHLAQRIGDGGGTQTIDTLCIASKKFEDAYKTVKNDQATPKMYFN